MLPFHRKYGTLCRMRWSWRLPTSHRSRAASSCVLMFRVPCRARSRVIGAVRTTAVRCIDVAALVAAAVLRKNPSATIMPFEQAVVPVDLNSRDSVMTNAGRLASIGGGGTNCSAPVQMLNKRKANADLIIFVSDNESWVDAGRGRGTALMAEWSEFRQRNPKARLVCLDIQPNQTTQAAERADILNIGEFSDQVFEVISAFAAEQLEADHWIARIEAVDA